MRRQKRANSIISCLNSFGIDYADFSGEEGHGRFLDLHSQHDQFVNLKDVQHIEYIQYLHTFDRLFEMPRPNKAHNQYTR